MKETGLKRVLLGIDKENPQSNAFWAKNGFSVIREIKQEGETDHRHDAMGKYLCYVRSHTTDWMVTTQILYGSRDNLTSFETIHDFTKNHNAMLTVMEGGEHWFHIDEQISF